MRFPLFPNWDSSRRRKKSSKRSRSAQSRPLRLEQLESREMLSVTLGSLNSIQVPGGKSVLVPLNSVDSHGGPVNYTFSSSNPAVQVSLVSPTSKSIVMNVSGTDSSNAPFTGTIVMHLFEDLAPTTTARIEQLVTQGYYNGLLFHRVLDGFVAQTGQTNGGADTGQLLDTEFDSSLTYTSPGLLGMASRGGDTADAEFFVTAIDAKSATTPIALADMPQFLTFKYTIFGQLVSGFDTFEKIMSAHVVSNNASTPEISVPSPSITVTSATLINDTQDAVLRVFAPASFDGSSATITVTATNSANETSTRSFTASAVLDSHMQNGAAIDPPFLGPVTNHETAYGKPTSFTLTAADLSGQGTSFAIGLAPTGKPPTNVTATIDQATGIVTLTPIAGFSGTISMLVGVTTAAQTTAYDTQAFTLTVNAPPTLAAVADQTIAAGLPVNLSLSSSSPSSHGIFYSVVDANTLAAPANVDVVINQATGQVTLTPHDGFRGTWNLLARVRDIDSPDVAANYTTRAFNLNVVTLDTLSDQTTQLGTPVTFTLTTVPAAGSVAYKIAGQSTFDPPASVAVVVNQVTGQVTLTPAPGFVGTVNLRAGVRGAASADAEANYWFETFKLTVAAEPTLNNIDNKTTAIGAATAFTLGATDPGAGGVFFVISEPAATGHVLAAVDSTTGIVLLTPAPGFTGTVTFRAGVRGAQAIDNPLNYDTQDFTLTVAAPTLDAIANQSTAVGKPVNLNLSANDSIGHTLVYSLLDAATLAAPVDVDVDVDQLTGHATLTPHSGYHGTANLVARVRDAQSPDVATNYVTQAFALNVVAPTLAAIGDQSVAAGLAASVSLDAGDPLGHGLVYTVLDAASLLPPNNVDLNIDQLTGHVTLTPHAGFHGSLNLLAGVRDADSPDAAANYTTQAFKLNVVAPALPAIGDRAAAAGMPISFALNATDALGHEIVYTLVDADTMESPADVDVTLVQATGQLTLTPHAGFHGIVHLIAAARDADSPDVAANYATQAFALNVFTLDAVSDQATELGTPVTFTLTTSPSGGNELYKIVAEDTFGAPANVTVGINQATGQVTLTPTAGFVGTVNLRAAVRGADSVDEETSYSIQSFKLVIAAGPNFAGSIDNQSTELGTPVSFTVTSNDPEAGGVFYKIFDQDTFAAPANVTFAIDQETGHVTLTPAAGFVGTIHLRIGVRGAQAVDAEANYDFENFTLTVAAGPTLNTVADQTTAVGASITFPLSSNDPASGGVFYKVTDLSATSHVVVNVNQATAQVTVTVTPDAGFTGTVHLRAAVRGAQAVDDPANYDTQDFSLIVVAPTLGTVSDKTTAVGVAATFTLTSTDTLTSGVVYSVVDASTLAAPTNADVSIAAGTGQVTVTPHAGFHSTLVLLARVRNANSPDVAQNYATQTFSVNVVAPLLGAVGDQSTTKGTAVNLTLTSTDPLGAGVFYAVVDPTTFGTPANVTVSINQATGQVTLTPAAGFTGTINLLAEVRSISSPDVQSNYVIQAFSLAVTDPASQVPPPPTSLAIDSSSDTGPFIGNGYITTGTPKLTVTAATGSTVKFKLNGVVIATATETGTGTGTFAATLPAGTLAVGANSITATATGTGGTSSDSAAMSLIYAPDYSGGAYVVPGAPGQSETLTIDWTAKNASFNNEYGYFIADSADGSIGDVAPGDAGYAQAALSSTTRTTLFSKGQSAGATSPVTLEGGQTIVFYLIQNNTVANFLAKNPTNANHGNNQSSAPLAFFSIAAANPDGMKHTQIIADSTTGRVQYNWEDLINLGDSDFNDASIIVRPASDLSQQETLHVPGTGTTTVSLDGTFHSEKQAAPGGDVGVYFVDDPSGAIGSLHPGDVNYASAALAAANSKVLFSSSSSDNGTASVPVTAGKYLAFYLITSGTTTDFLSTNSTNAAGAAQALFSFDAANPDSVNHFRWYAPGQQKTDPNAVELHIMDQVAGKASDFDAYKIALSFAASS